MFHDGRWELLLVSLIATLCEMTCPTVSGACTLHQSDYRARLSCLSSLNERLFFKMARDIKLFFFFFFSGPESMGFPPTWEGNQIDNRRREGQAAYP